MGQTGPRGLDQVGVGSAVDSPGRMTMSGDGMDFTAYCDVHVRIWLGGTAFDYRAAATAAGNLIRDWHQKHWCAIELVRPTGDQRLPETRLPNERLFLGP